MKTIIKISDLKFGFNVQQGASLPIEGSQAQIRIASDNCLESYKKGVDGNVKVSITKDKYGRTFYKVDAWKKGISKAKERFAKGLVEFGTNS